jgi:hypothetical protein
MLRFDRLREIYRTAARWGFNTVLFEYEDRFPYRGRLGRISADDALTPRQIRELNGLAADLGLRIMPLVQCLGHLEYALRVPAFRGMAETLRFGPCAAVCPSRTDATGLFRDMAAQVLELHPDCHFLHMGGDEVGLDPRCPRCRPRIRAGGIARVLAEHYAACADWLRRQGPDPVIWGDMILAHPEEMDRLRGRVVIMDWDYWSGIRPSRNAVIWGARGKDFRKPRTWPPNIRRLFARVIPTDDGRCARPFPYVSFLQERGFQVITASAARCYGDSFCVPAPLHVENVMGAAKVAAQHHTLGSVITSWALRRSPWPLTEHILLAGAMTMRNPDVSRRAVDTAFAREHFGVADPSLARIPLLLGASVSGLLDSFPCFDLRTGRWPGEELARRVELIRKDVPLFRRQLRVLRRNLRQAAPLLGRLRPKTPWQRERTRFWRWAAALLGLSAEFGPQLLRPPAFRPVPPAIVRSLSRETRLLLSRWYTVRTIEDEQQTRFGILAFGLRSGK